MVISAILLLAIASLTSAVSVINVASYPTEVAQGETVNINVEIENIFEYDIFNLNVNLDLSGIDVPFAPYQTSSERFLDKLKDGDDETFGFKLIALPSADSGIHKLPITITYENEDGEVSTKSELISITINSAPELTVSVDSQEPLIKGSEGVLSIKIINSGLSDIKFVYLSAGDATGIRFLSEREQYIGDLDSDDFDTIEYNIHISELASSLTSLPVIIKFKDSTNKEFMITKTVTISTYDLTSAQNLGLVDKPNYVIPLVVVIVILWYLIRRTLKKRKRRKNRRPQ